MDAWYETALEVEEAIMLGQDFSLAVTDVVKAIDSVRREVLYAFLARLGVTGWLVQVYARFHAGVSTRFKLALGVGGPLAEDGGMPARS